MYTLVVFKLVLRKFMVPVCSLAPTLQGQTPPKFCRPPPLPLLFWNLATGLSKTLNVSKTNKYVVLYMFLSMFIEALCSINYLPWMLNFKGFVITWCLTICWHCVTNISLLHMPSYRYFSKINQGSHIYVNSNNDIWLLVLKFESSIGLSFSCLEFKKK